MAGGISAERSGPVYVRKKKKKKKKPLLNKGLRRTIPKGSTGQISQSIPPSRSMITGKPVYRPLQRVGVYTAVVGLLPAFTNQTPGGEPILGLGVLSIFLHQHQMRLWIVGKAGPRACIQARRRRSHVNQGSMYIDRLRSRRRGTAMEQPTASACANLSLQNPTPNPRFCRR